MVDALASGASGRKAVEVRVLSWAPNSIEIVGFSCSFRDKRDAAVGDSYEPRG